MYAHLPPPPFANVHIFMNDKPETHLEQCILILFFCVCVCVCVCMNVKTNFSFRFLENHSSSYWGKKYTCWTFSKEKSSKSAVNPFQRSMLIKQQTRWKVSHDSRPIKQGHDQIYTRNHLQNIPCDIQMKCTLNLISKCTFSYIQMHLLIFKCIYLQ